MFVVYLWFPGDHDHTLFELGAARLADGAVYYRDFWDIKQPGIYWFYQLGLALGVGVAGPRLLELALAGFGGWLVWRLAAGWHLHVVARVLAPVLVIGSYLLHTHHGGVAVIEGLITPLLVCVLVLVWPAGPAGGPPRAGRRWLAAGLAAGVIGVLKILYLPLPAFLILGALVASRSRVQVRLRLAALAVAGTVLPLAAMSAYFALNGAWRVYWVTTLLIPLETVQVPVLGSGRERYLELAVGQAALLLPLAAVAVGTAARRRTRARDATLLATVLAALALAWPQFPTPYRLLVLVAPLALLAAVGADVVLRHLDARADARADVRRGARADRHRTRRRFRARLAAIALLAVLALPSLRGPQRLLFAAPDVPSWSLGVTGRDARDEILINEFASKDVAPVRGLVAPGDSVYIIGHPQGYQLLGAREAIEIAGWGAILQPARVWSERDRQLARSRPEWVFVETDTRDLVNRLSPRFARELSTSYRRVATAPRGVWYRTDSPGVPSGIPGDNRIAEG